MYISQDQLRTMEGLKSTAYEREMAEADKRRASTADLAKAIKESKANDKFKYVDPATFELEAESDEELGYSLHRVRLSARDRRYIEMPKRPRRTKTEAECKRDEALNALLRAKMQRMKMAALETSGESNGHSKNGSSSRGSSRIGKLHRGDATNDAGATDSDATEDNSLDDPSTDDDGIETVEQRRRRRIRKIARESRRQRKANELNGTLTVYKPTVELTAKRLADGSFIEIDPKTRRCVAEPCSKKPDASFWSMSTRDLARFESRSSMPECQKCDQPMPKENGLEGLPAIDLTLPPLRLLTPIADGYSPLR